MMPRNFALALLALAVPALVPVAQAHADTVLVTLTPPTESITAGGTTTFLATLSAPSTNGAAVYLNNDSLTLGSIMGADLDGSDLLLNFDEDLLPGQSESGALFTVTLPSGVANGSYGGEFVLQGGGDPNTQDALDTVPFTLDVGSGTAAVTPEPPAALMFATGLVGLAALGWKRRIV